MTRGIYFLCNDRLISMAIAFLNAFREYNPKLPLCLIPYKDDDIEELLGLSETYDFSVFPDQGILDGCDQISERISPRDQRFRKLAIWEGVFDQFIYIDVDNLVLEDISYLFDLLDTYSFVLCDSNVDGNDVWSWDESIYSSGLLTEAQIKFAANTSLIVSSRGKISLADLTRRKQEIDAVIPYMQLRCGEQSLLNYLIVTSGFPSSSITDLQKIDEGLKVGLGYWAGSSSDSDIEINALPGGKLELNDPSQRVTFIHWSGLWQAGRFDHYVRRILQLISMRRRDKVVIRWWFPYKKFWLYYRYLRR
jgi:hypothetical protein